MNRKDGILSVPRTAQQKMRDKLDLIEAELEKERKRARDELDRLEDSFDKKASSVRRGNAELHGMKPSDRVTEGGPWDPSIDRAHERFDKAMQKERLEAFKGVVDAIRYREDNRVRGGSPSAPVSSPKNNSKDVSIKSHSR